MLPSLLQENINNFYDIHWQMAGGDVYEYAQNINSLIGGGSFKLLIPVSDLELHLLKEKFLDSQLYRINPQ